MKVDQEARMTIGCLAARGERGREIARLLGITEGTVRYHLRRRAEGAADGRTRQRSKAEGWAEAIGAYVAREGGRCRNVAALHAWLRSEHEYAGSLRSVERYVSKRYPAPAVRARRRVETPPGAQAQVDWAEWPLVRIGGRTVYAYEFHLRLSHSRYGARIWSPRKDQLSWHQVHNEALRRIDGVPAVVRVDNERTAVARGAGAWGELNASYRRYACTVRFHIDACSPRSPEAKGKVERGIRTARGWPEVTARSWVSWEELQAWTDERMSRESQVRVLSSHGDDGSRGVGSGEAVLVAGSALARAVRCGGDASGGGRVHGGVRRASLLGAVRVDRSARRGSGLRPLGADLRGGLDRGGTPASQSRADRARSPALRRRRERACAASASARPHGTALAGDRGTSAPAPAARSIPALAEVAR